MPVVNRPPVVLGDMVLPPAMRTNRRQPAIRRVRLGTLPRRPVATRLAAGLAVAVFVVVGFSGCGLIDQRQPVAVIGDSITWQSSGPIDDALGDRWRPDVRAVPGATIGDMVDVAGDMARGAPLQLLVNLGTNDAAGKLPPEQSAADFERLLDQFDTVRCVHLVTVYDYMFTYADGFLTPWSQVTNAALADVAVRRGVDVINWTAVVTAQQAVPGSPDMLVDTIHPTPAGVDVLVDTYAEAFERGCPELGSAT